MTDGPRRKRVHLWVRLYAAIFDIDEGRLQEATGTRLETDDAHAQTDTAERDDTTGRQ